MTITKYILLFCLISTIAQAQIGGEGAYNFLYINNSARIAALGGNNISIRDNDVNMAYSNPALLSDSMDMSMALNFVPYISDIKIGYASIAKHYDNIGTFAVGVHTVSYGDFVGADEYDNVWGSFTASEHAVHMMYAKKLTPGLSIGATIKPIFSNLYQYNSFALLSDIGLVFSNKSKLFNVAMTLKNYGYQLSNNYKSGTDNVEPDLVFGFSQKLAHAPFRFSLTASSLLVWDLTHTVNEDENGSAISFGESDAATFGNQLVRHLTAGLEFMPSKNFYIAAGYNFRNRNSLKIDEKPGTTGISWGFGFRVSKFHIAYGSARYHLGASSNHFSITTNLSSFL